MENATNTPRRAVMTATLGAIATWRTARKGVAPAHAAPPALEVRGDAPEQRIDIKRDGVAGWTVVAGQWTVEDMAGAPDGPRALVQRATRNPFNVIVAPAGPFADVDVAVRFHPISGREDASGGIVFRFADGKYYVIRANALEDNFRLYAYDGTRRQLATARVTPPALKQWHTLRVVAVGDRIQGWLDGALLLDHRDARFKAGRVGLWTKADSVTAFADVVVRGTRP